MSFIIKSRSNSTGNLVPIEYFINNSNLNSYDYLSPISQRIIDSFCARVNSIEDLTEIDKIILVSNYLQSTVQYCNGKITTANNKKYETEYEGNREEFSSPNTAIEKKYGNCASISGSFHIIGERLGLKVDRVDVGDHSYCIYNYNGKIYIIDPTFGCSRNENQVKGAPKATKFSDKYVMVSLMDLKDTGHHLLTTMITDDPKLATKQLDRTIITKSVEKLKSKGIEFDYPNKAVLQSRELEQETQENVTEK